MQLRQIVVFEQDGQLAAMLAPLAESRGWLLREPRQTEACVRLLDRSEPAALVVRIGHSLETEFDVLDAVSRAWPRVAIVAVSESDSPALLGLAWDLGASYVVTAPNIREQLLELVPALLGAAEAPR
jgi:DNA-binding response OmpR family regulator